MQPIDNLDNKSDQARHNGTCQHTSTHINVLINLATSDLAINVAAPHRVRHVSRPPPCRDLLQTLAQGSITTQGAGLLIIPFPLPFTWIGDLMSMWNGLRCPIILFLLLELDQLYTIYGNNWQVSQEQASHNGVAPPEFWASCTPWSTEI